MVRHRRVRRAARGGAGLRAAGTTTALLRAALETAMAVAREGERSTPPVPAPAPLRRYLGFARLPDPALEIAKRVLDDDDAFRARVATAVAEDDVGRAGWVFLTRPDGWQGELDALRKEAASQSATAREERAERGASRKLAGAEAAAARAEARAVSASAEAERLRAELDQARAEAQSAAGEVARLREQLGRTTEERAAAIQRVKDAEAAATARAAELRAVRHELRMTKAELTQASEAVGEPGDIAGAPTAVDHEALATAVSDALAALGDVGAALQAMAGVLPVPEVSSSTEDAGDAAPPRRRRAAPLEGRSRRRRRPVGLPGGVLDDSLEAADHLVRAPGVLLLVDGYNISHARWYGSPLHDQRARLLDACAQLHARCGTDVEVVFDGSSDAGTSSTQARPAVRHRFTAAGEEADDVILARVDEEPPDRPVVVASSDRRVRDGARQRGANVLGARQLLAVLRR